MNTQVIHAVMAETQAGDLIFPEVVRRLAEIGVESYLVDLAAHTQTFYFAGATHVEPMTLPATPVAPDFSAPNLIAAIRGAQADTVRYPEFMQRSAAAGVIAYWCYITGRKVVYFGRKGETHTEHFPTAP